MQIWDDEKEKEFPRSENNNEDPKARVINKL